MADDCVVSAGPTGFLRAEQRLMLRLLGTAGVAFVLRIL